MGREDKSNSLDIIYEVSTHNIITFFFFSNHSRFLYWAPAHTYPLPYGYYELSVPSVSYDSGDTGKASGVEPDENR